MWLLLPNFKRPQVSHALPHWWETLCLREMQILVQAVCSFEEPHEEAYTQGINTRKVIFSFNIDLNWLKLRILLLLGCSFEETHAWWKAEMTKNIPVSNQSGLQRIISPILTNWKKQENIRINELMPLGSKRLQCEVIETLQQPVSCHFPHLATSPYLPTTNQPTSSYQLQSEHSLPTISVKLSPSFFFFKFSLTK